MAGAGVTGTASTTAAVEVDAAEVDAVVRAALTGRRELVLLDEPSVMAVARLLATVCRDAGIWVRTAVGTLDRFAREGAGGDLAGLLAAGRADATVARRSLADLADRHPDLAAGQLAALAFGPKLWWTVAGVPVAWRPLSSGAAASAGAAAAGAAAAGAAAAGVGSAPATHVPLPVPGTDPDVRLLLLALIGSGTTEAELAGVRVRDAGALDAAGQVLPDLDAEPMALAYTPDEGGPRRVTFLSWEARSALRDRLAARGPLAPDAPLLLPPNAQVTTAEAANARSAALIAAGNDVNVTLCRATGDFFRAWGMPGSRFVPRDESLERTEALPGA